MVGHEGVLTAAVAAVAVAAGARPVLLMVIAALRAGDRAVRGLVGGLAAALEASTARRAALGLLGSGAVLLAPSPGAAAAPVADARADAAAGPRAPHPIELVDHAGSAERADRTDPADRTDRTAPSDVGTSVVVRPGDSLWSIARRHLPAGATDAQVAEAWPRWWRANRTVIGPDPHLIHPGTRLVVPPRIRSTGTSTTAATAAPSFDPDRR